MQIVKDMKIVTYEPDNSIKRGYSSIFSEITDEFIKTRWLTLQLFRRDFFAMYKQSFIGIFWTFVMPIVSIGTFIILNRAGIFTIGKINLPYPIYALLGMAFWQLFSTGLIASTGSLARAGGMITKINVSKKALVIASIGQSIVSFLIQYIVLGILFIGYKIMPTTGILLTPILVMPIILFTLGLGFILSLLNAIMRDIVNVVSIAMTFLLFLTPILYSEPAGFLGTITKYNPLYYMISVPRELILFGTILQLKGYLISVGLSIIIFVVCLIAFHLTEVRIAERV